MYTHSKIYRKIIKKKKIAYSSNPFSKFMFYKADLSRGFDQQLTLSTEIRIIELPLNSS